MNIAILHWAFPPTIGGVETHLAILAPELVKRGCQVHLLTGSEDNEDEESYYQGVRVVRTPLMNLNNLRSLKVSSLAGQIKKEIIEFIEEAQPELIHAHNMHYFSPVHTEILAEIRAKTDIPLILTAHNVWDDELWGKMIKMAEIWDGVIAVSYYIKKELIKAGYRAERIKVIHHGIDAEKFKPPTEEDLQKILEEYPQFKGRRIIFHPARMSLAKGCDYSVRALKIIAKEFPEVLLVMSGNQKIVDWVDCQEREVNMVMGLVEEFGLQNNVFATHFPWPTMPRIYQTAEICIYPSSFEEPFGLVMLESMATAKPIVVSRSGGMPEIVRHGENGFIVERRNPEDLAEKCIRLLKRPARARKMGEVGRQMVEKLYTKEIMTENTLEFYKSVLSGGFAVPATAQKGFY
ncbi:glycosyltransferase family 4 protein [Calderihabitans maritimus]|uniref:Glycosyltransferase n=1 Tax=Calderihabitans maritimus TaxID=1246530 RepID=A0A1Z5HRQ0_9FIRM|nr:glycosyltransferase family 4 protein [Calderihabitans maritimus]GAW92001.1 glycosyltransferase [Calderihabitans maritimus]